MADDLIVIALSLAQIPIWVAVVFLAVAALGFGTLIWDAIAA